MMYAGIVPRPISAAARIRRSPEMSSYPPLSVRRTVTAWMTPFCRIDSFSSSRAWGSKSARGCSGLGRIREISSRVTEPPPFTTGASGAARSTVRAGSGSAGLMRAESPLPRPRLGFDTRHRCRVRRGRHRGLSSEEFPGQFHVVPGAAGHRLVEQHRLPVTRGLAQPDVPADDRRVHFLPEVFFHVLDDL